MRITDGSRVPMLVKSLMQCARWEPLRAGLACTQTTHLGATMSAPVRRLTATVLGRMAAHLVCVLVLAVSSSTSLLGQTVTGRALDANSRRAVAGTVVQVLGERDSVLARSISGSSGRFVVRLPAGARAVRALHVGYSPTIVPITDAQAIDGLSLEMTRLATLLDGMRVRANTACRPSERRERANALFDQMRYALLASVVSAEADSQSVLGLVRFVRYMDRRSDRINSQDVTIDTVRAEARPFLAVRSLIGFVDSGFVSGEGDRRRYFAPDAEILFGDAFPAAYCIDLLDANKARANQIGVHFSRARGARGRVDIEGEIWIDTLSRTLQDLNFRYVGLPSEEASYRPGGQVNFLELPNGSVVVQRWSLRLVATRSDSIRISLDKFNVRRFYEVQETGGEAASIQFADGARWRSDLGSLQLAVQRAADDDPTLADIALEHTNYGGRSNAGGRSIGTDTVVFDHLLPGPYVIIVNDRELAKIDVTLKPPLTFTAERGRATALSMRMPTALDYAKSLCEPEPQGETFKRFDHEKQTQAKITRPKGGMAAFFVYVTDESGTPIGGATVTEWPKLPTEPAEFRSDRIIGKTDHGGRYFSCWNFGRGETAQIWVRVPGQPPQVTLVALDKKVTAIRIVVPKKPPASPQPPTSR